MIFYQNLFVHNFKVITLVTNMKVVVDQIVSSIYKRLLLPTTRPRDQLVSYESREHGSIPEWASFSQCIFHSLFSILILNYFILVNWHHQNDQMVTPVLVI